LDLNGSVGLNGTLKVPNIIQALEAKADEM